MDDGRVFHRTGAALLNARAPHRVAALGSRRRWAPADLSARVGTYSCRRSAMYSGASPFSALYTWMSSLYCILCSTGSQWRFIRTGLIWSLMRVRVTTRAAMFWHFWSFATVSPGRPASRSNNTNVSHVMQSQNRQRPLMLPMSACMAVISRLFHSSVRAFPSFTRVYRGT